MSHVSLTPFKNRLELSQSQNTNPANSPFPTILATWLRETSNLKSQKSSTVLSLRETFLTLPAKNQKLLKKKLGDHALQTLFSISLEKIPQLYENRLLAVGEDFMRQGKFDVATSIFQLLRSPQLSASSSIRKQAELNLSIFNGTAPLLHQTELIARQTGNNLRDLSTWVGLGVGTGFYQGGKTAALALMLTGAGRGLVSTTFGAKVASVLFGFGLEGITFATATRLTTHLTGTNTDGRYFPNLKEITSNYFVLGGLRSANAMAGALVGAPTGSALNRGYQTVVTQIGTVGGTLLGHGLETFVGLKDPQTAHKTFAETLALVGQFGVMKRISPTLFGRKFYHYMGNLEGRSQELLRQGISKQVSIPSLKTSEVTAGAQVANFGFQPLKDSKFSGIARVSETNSTNPDFSTAQIGRINTKQAIIEYGKKSSPVIEPAKDELVVTTYNVGFAAGEKNKGGQGAEQLTKKEVVQNLDQIVGALQPIKPDVLLLQEIDLASARTHRINQLEHLAKGLEMYFGAHVVTWDVAYLPFPGINPLKWYGRVYSGQAVLSKHPIVSQESYVFDKPPNPSWYNFFYIDRIAQRVGINHYGQEINLFNTHLEAFHHNTRLAQVNQLANWTKRVDGPKITAGDFNSGPVIESLTPAHQAELLILAGKEFQKTLIPGQEHTPAENIKMISLVQEGITQFKTQSGMTEALSTAPTFQSWDPFVGLDHILYSPHFNLLRTGAVTTLQASDHIPLWAALKINSYTPMASREVR